MSALAIPTPRVRRLAGEPTLDEVISRCWSELGRRRAVECPLCGGAMKPEYGAHPRPLGGRCTDCGSTLA